MMPECVSYSPLFRQGDFFACKKPLPVPGLPVQCAATPPVAQLDRALPSGGKGQGFKSLRAGHLFLKPRYALQVVS